MRDLIVSLIVVGALPLCYKRPFIGLLMFSILAYMRLQDLAWGFARYQRWSYYVALAMGAGYLVSRSKRLPLMDIRTVMMGLLVASVGIGLFFARGERDGDARYIEFVKVVGVAVFTTAVVRTREHLRIMMWVIGLCFAFFGAKSGLAGIIKLGNIYIKRGPGGMLEDNNDFALALAMSIPVLLHLGTSERREILRKGVWFMIPLTMVTIVLTRSRGGTLSMAMALSALTWRSRNRFLGFGLLGVSALAVLALAPAEYRERISTIKDYETEGSAASRIAAWKVAGRMIQDNPITGVGLRRFQANYVDYEPNPTPAMLAGEGTIVAHNSYLQIWAECGTPAFALYMGLLLISFIDIWSIRRRAKAKYYQSWILSYCTMFEAVLATFMLGSMFLNRAHFDLVYHYVAIILCFGRIARDEMRRDDMLPTRRTGRPGGTLVATPARGFGARRLAPSTGFRKTALVPEG